MSCSMDLWLKGAIPRSDNRYQHRRLDESVAMRSVILPELQQAIYEAHEDARRRLREIEGISLDPLHIPPGEDPAEGYPQQLHMNTLMGYFGEILAGLICEAFGPLEEVRWQVPAHLFRFHLDEFRHLDQIHQVGLSDNPDKEIRYGRHGDDCLAFVLNEDGTIARTLFCEAKCVNRHSTGAIRDAHKKVSEKVSIPLDRQQIIEVLLDNDSPEAKAWVTALRLLRFQQNNPEYERCDMVCYVCGEPPVISDHRISQAQPHPDYTGGRRLAAVEVYIDDIHQLVKKLYGKREPDSDE